AAMTEQGKTMFTTAKFLSDEESDAETVFTLPRRATPMKGGGVNFTGVFQGSDV
ncbi:hypothetical protein HK097_011031, partial [Rhizophlyctis rosea]